MAKKRPKCFSVYDASFVENVSVNEAKPYSAIRDKTHTKNPQNPQRTNNRQRIDSEMKKPFSRTDIRPKYVKKSSFQGNRERRGDNINRTLRVQSPAARKAGHQEKKITGSAKNIEVNKHRHTEKKTFRIKKKRNSLKTFFARLVLFLVEFAIIAGAFSAIFVMKLYSDTDNSKNLLNIYVGDKNDEAYYHYVSGTCLLNSVYYICADDLMELFSLTVTGTKNHLHYLTSQNEFVSFDVGTRNASINGTDVKLESFCFTKGGRLYVPVSFFVNYAIGVVITTDNGKINIERVELPMDTSGRTSYEELSFSLKQEKISFVMDEDDAKGSFKQIDEENE